MQHHLRYTMKEVLRVIAAEEQACGREAEVQMASDGTSLILIHTDINDSNVSKYGDEYYIPFDSVPKVEDAVGDKIRHDLDTPVITSLLREVAVYRFAGRGPTLFDECPESV